MPPLCECLHSSTGWGKATVLISLLGKSHKRSRERKTSKHHYEFGYIFAALLASPLLAFVTFPSAPPARLTRWSPALTAAAKAASSYLANPSTCCRGRELGKPAVHLTLHGAGSFCHLLLPFLPCLTKISLTKEKVIPLADVLKWCQFKSWTFKLFLDSWT